ncbi:MAG: c-type cytochrome [Pseudomonadota bacterium]
MSRFVPHAGRACAFVVLVLALAACGGGESAPGSTGAAAPDPGARLYVQNCIACHPRNGEGVPGVQPALAGTASVVGDPRALLAWVMYGERPASLPKGAYRGVMPHYAYLKDEELALLLTHVRTNFGNAAAPITPAMVAEVRAARGGR